MKELLERWSRLEPNKCRNEHDKFGFGGNNWTYWIFSNDLNNLIPGDLAWIQYAVQQAIIEKEWYFCILYNKELYQIEMGSEQPSPRFMRGENLVEALLSAYLAELEASANP